jgi:PKD repeat protein
MAIRPFATTGILLAAAALLAGAAGSAEGDLYEPLFVNYGTGASIRQGDNDHHQAIYLSVPATTAGPLYVRIFDPDTTNYHDQMDKRFAATRTRFSVFGGPGAFIERPTDPERLTEAELTAGTKLVDKTFGSSRREGDNAWVTLAELNPADGETVGDRIVFRLVVDALSGPNGNVYDVAVSLKDDANEPPPGFKMFGYTPTVRMPRRGVLTELRFRIPETAKSLSIGNFDAAFGEAFFTTPLVSIPLVASGQGKMVTTTVDIGERYRGTVAAVTLSGGKEYPNDATFYVADDTGRLIPFELPPAVYVLNERPVPVARMAPLDACMAVAFDGSGSYDPEGETLAQVWRFGDGDSAAGARVDHAYTAEGRFEATLEVTGTAPQLGSGAPATVVAFVKNPPVAQSDKRLLVAVGEDVTFDGSPSTARRWSIVSHEWRFSDGTVLSGETVVHAFAAPGTYEVTHTVVDDSGHRCDTASETFTVTVNAPPVADAGQDRRIAIGEETVFDAGGSTDSDGRLVTYEWDFGDGASATGPVVRHAYASPATYTARLTVRDDSDVANSSDDDTVTAIVNAPPVAEAGPDRSVAIAEPVLFDAGKSADSDGSLIAYEWDFGDGTRGGGATVNHAYAKSGTYAVRLTVTDDSTTGTSTDDDTLSVRVNEPPVAVAGPDQLVTASKVDFDGSASSDLDDSIAEYRWDFGDGAAGSGPRPSHVYADTGTYPVRLTVTDASGTIRSSAEDTLEVVVNARPIADAGPDLVGAPGETLTFQGSRSLDPDGSIARYLWDFRDGTTATGQTVRHAFAKPGTYQVRLKVVDDTGQDEAVDYAEASAFINAPPVAAAGADVATVPGGAVRLSARDSFDIDGTIASYRWDFSDLDRPIEGATVERSFDKPGIYSVQLTVTDGSGAANAVATDSLIIAVNHEPVADAGPDIVTDGTTITFDGTRSVDGDGNPLSFAWDFGDGAKGSGAVVTHTYAEGGTYPVVLTVDDGTGLGNATARTAIDVVINRAPVAVAGDNKRVCTGDIVVLDGSRSRDPEGGTLRYAWDFGDGTAADIVNPTKSYSVGGTYPVTLTVKDDSDLGNDTAAARLSVQVDQGPVADAGDDILACARSEVAFDGSGSTDIDGVVNNFTWDFGDGNLGGGETPSHIYDKPGTYRVFLTINGEKAGICDSISTDEVEVKIIEGPVAVIKAPAAVPITETVAFDGSASYMAEGNIVDWQWDFGDGDTASGETVSHTYARAGTYTASLTLRSDSASPTCQVISARHIITVNAPPVADAGADRAVAVDEEAVFDASASTDPDGGIVAYEWDFGDGSTATGIDARHRYRSAGTYTATLTVRDGTGLANSAATDTATVTVNPEPAPAIAGPAVACVGETAAWKAAGTGSTYRWAFGDGAAADSAETTHAYAKPGRYSLVLLSDDGKGLANSRQQATQLVHVNLPPEAAAGIDRRACPGDVLAFDASASRDPDGAITAWRWDFGDGANAEGATASHAYAAPGTYVVKLTAIDDAGSACSSTTDTATVIVNATPVADAGGDRDVWIGGANDAILLDGSASRDPDGEALSHTWQIGDGASEIGERVRHTLAAPGDLPVTLTVSDTSGLACGTASTTFTLRAKVRE